MPPLPGEERLLTVYADIHYYFSQPSNRPVLHRFDKASYFYVYRNATRRTSRIEVANNPGTPEQDAFHGFLDTCRVINSHRFATLVTLIVDGTRSRASSPTSPRAARDPEEWRLASADPRDPGQAKYRLHTLDIYFWAQDDAKMVVDLFQSILHPSQLDVARLPQPTLQRQDSVSNVVRNLENVAISDPAYQNGQTRNSRTQAQQPETHPQTAIPLPPPPPPPPATAPPAASASTLSQQPQQSVASTSPTSSTAASVGRQTSNKDSKPVQDHTPIPYNPAAPAAPEQFAHREDTPPPPDADQGPGLSTVGSHDSRYNASGPRIAQPQPYTGIPTRGQGFSSPPSQNPTSNYGSPSPHNAYLPGPPSQAPSFSGPPGHAPSFAGPPSQAPSFAGPPSQAPSFAGPPTSPPQQDSRQTSTAPPSFAPPPKDPNAHMFGQDSVETPGAQFYASIPHTRNSVAHVQPQYVDYLSAGSKESTPPPGGYSDYQYNQKPQQQQQQQEQQQQMYTSDNPYDIHNQVYRPTEAEVKKHKPSKTSSQSATPKSKMEERADRVEKGVGKLFKKLEKRIG